MTSYWHATRPSSPDRSPVTHPLPDRADLVVVGAGITGLTTALLARRAGLDVLVIEARTLGAAATGNSTAKISLLQGTTLSNIRKHHDQEIVDAYVRSNTDGRDLLTALMEELGVDHQRETAYTYANTKKGMRSLEQEYAAAVAAGLPMRWTDTTELPYDVEGAIALDGQLQVHPMELLDALAGALEEEGGRVVEGVRVVKVGKTDTVLHTSAGDVRADAVVMATGAPVLDRAGHFARVVAQRSYALSFAVPDDAAVPHGMYLSADQPSRSIRYTPSENGRLLLVGGNGHEVGRDRRTDRRVQQLVDWTREHWGTASLTHTWSAQDYEFENMLPVVQKLPGKAMVWQASGFQKWGFTNGPASALALVAAVTGEPEPSWRTSLRQRVPGLRDLGHAAVAQQKVGYHMTRGWAQALVDGQGDPAPGEGVVRREGAKVVATSNIDGRLCSVSGVCPHLGGILTWNPAEKSWDCPLHGSRFSPEGEVLEGFATRGLD
jgi:glycine/D-amino acid oxidase-like deaminating enzyme/nitrite reductase/ring-hydroxylating ferredoxin subunit